MAQIIQCPQCQRELQVPDEFVGQPVKCPSCGLTFVTSPPSGPQPPTLSVQPAPPRDGGATPPTAGSSRAMVVIPAVFLLLIGMLAMFFDTFGIVITLNPGLVPPPEKMPEMPELVRKAYRDDIRERQQQAGFYLARHGAFDLAAFIMVVASVQMMRLRMWRLALAGSILAMLHIDTCCCCAGLPIGIWSVAILARSDVRALFDRPT